MDLDPEKVREILSANIKKRRKILGISQEKLAEITELSAQTVNDIEGRHMWVSDKTMAKLCQALHIEAYQLLLPQIERIDAMPTAPAEILLNLQKGLKTNIDVQFDELFKSGLF